MQNNSKREKLKNKLRKLRKDHQKTSDKAKKEKLLDSIFAVEDELLKLQFDDDDLQRFRR